jgi:tRNA A-37 threonylcarbamoyl transferase component Bud32
MTASNKTEESPQAQAAPRAQESTESFSAGRREDGADSASLAAAPGMQFPVSEWDRYEFLELIGRGGMGVVYKARDRRLGRHVALKFIRGADPERVMRLLQEARTQSRIDHPNVCKVYEVGEVQGKAYIAMQLMAGEQLGRVAPRLSLADKVWVMKEVAAAVHEAHRLGVIHRDLKPSNILVERAESGRWVPVVMDFGLAYEVNQGHGLTQTGAVMGTPSYMAPEQAKGEVRSIDRRTDVYSLGATFYELLTGVPPFIDATLVGTLAKVLNEEPRPLRSHVPLLPVELETIILKCLSKEPHLRYASARAVAEDLERYLDGEPILGQRLSLVQRWKKQARRHRTLVAVSGLSLLSVLVFAVVGARSWVQAGYERQQSQARARLAEQLGQQANGMEWLMWTAYMLPLHDLSREEQQVREQMKQIASSKHELGGYGNGLVHYALGRGHLARGLKRMASTRRNCTTRLSASVASCTTSSSRPRTPTTTWR